MKKVYLAVSLAFSVVATANAQLSKGGLPLSMRLNEAGMDNQVVYKTILPEPDYNALAQQDLQDAIAGVSKPYRVAATVKTEITLDQGTWFYLENGDKIWRAKIEVPGAQAISLAYSDFYLPEGVELFVSNENRRQILGAYTSQNNSKYNVFSNQEVQGHTALLELNVPAGVDVASVRFRIEDVYAFYKGVADLQSYAEAEGPIKAKPADASPSCHVNANCDPGMTEPYLTAKNATVKIFSDGGLCSGTLINSAGNVQDGVCKQYLLTASHCDGANSRDNAHFATWQFRFNYQYAECENSRPVPGNDVLVGADFLARSNNPSFTDRKNSLVLDFLLLELTSPIPVGWGAMLAGWNRNTDLAFNSDYDFYIGFHHPSGDYKKLSTASYIEHTGVFNQEAIKNTHWKIDYTRGGTSPGSSGSGLFDKDGLLIGDLSGGSGGDCEGKDFGINALYSKLSEAWENAFDQRTFPEYAGKQSRLKDWLDPLDVDIKKFQATKIDCSDLDVSVKDLDDMLSRSVTLYPNPTSGAVNINMNLSSTSDIYFTVYDITGAKKADYTVSKAQSGLYSIDMGVLPNGIYMITIKAGNATTSKKVVLSR